MIVLQPSTALPGKPGAHPRLIPTRFSRPLLLQAGWCFLFFVVAIAPLLAFKVPLLSDYMNHLARCYLIAIDGRDPLLAQFYGIEWRLIPNLAIDLIVPPLAEFFNIYVAGKIFLVATMLLLVTGPQFIHHALFRRLSFGPLVASLFIYNEATVSGLVNYLFGIGVAMVGVAAWINLRQRPTVVRAAVSAGFVVALYVSHFGALGLYAVALFGLEIWQAYFDTGHRRDASGHLLALLVPFLAVPVLALLGPGADDLISGSVSWTLYDKLRGFLFIIESQTVSRIPDAIVGAVMIALGFWAWSRGLVRMHPAGLVVAIIGFCAFLLTPVQIMSAWGADVRQPLGYLFILIGFLDWRLPNARARNIFLLTIFGLLIARTSVVQYAWERLSVTTEEIVKSTALIKPGSKVLIGEVDGRYDHVAHYVPCAAMIERSSLCSLAFSDPRQQVLTVKPPFRAITGGYNNDPLQLSLLVAAANSSDLENVGNIYWGGWTHNYDYLYILATSAGDRNPLPDRLAKIYEGHNFQMYQILR